jgi:hypothetical protein
VVGDRGARSISFCPELYSRRRHGLTEVVLSVASKVGWALLVLAQTGQLSSHEIPFFSSSWLSSASFPPFNPEDVRLYPQTWIWPSVLRDPARLIPPYSAL